MEISAFIKKTDINFLVNFVIFTVFGHCNFTSRRRRLSTYSIRKLASKSKKMKISKTLLIPIFLMIGSGCCAIFDDEIAHIYGDDIFGTVVTAQGNSLKDKYSIHHS